MTQLCNQAIQLRDEYYKSTSDNHVFLKEVYMDHLGHCPVCREYLAEANKIAAAPLTSEEIQETE